MIKKEWGTYRGTGKKGYSNIYNHHIHITSISHPYHIHIILISHPYHIHITSISHPYYIHITSISHPYHIHITSISHPYHILITSLSHPYHIHITSISHPFSSNNYVPAGWDSWPGCYPAGPYPSPGHCVLRRGPSSHSFYSH